MFKYYFLLHYSIANIFHVIYYYYYSPFDYESDGLVRKFLLHNSKVKNNALPFEANIMIED